MTSAVERWARARERLVGWFAVAQRDLPWRRARDPYAIWISEVMLQQTRVETVAPRYARWLDRFPTVSALAGAPLDEVLGEWAGLGYYARARNLHRAAKEVRERYGGRFPDDEAAVRALPGIGDYTAGAILSLAFGQRAPILDGNVVRVLGRLTREAEPVTSPAARRRLRALAGELVAAGDPSAINQGLMELGALICTPRRPGCGRCPLADDCAARAHGDAEAFPVAGPRTAVKRVDQVAVAICRRGRLLLCRRPDDSGLWGGLYELPTDELAAGESILDAALRIARRRVGLTVGGGEEIGGFAHLLSHRRIVFRGVITEAGPGPVRRRGYDAHRWVALTELPPLLANRRLGVSRATAKLLEILLTGGPSPGDRRDGSRFARREASRPPSPGKARRASPHRALPAREKRVTT